MKRRAEVEKSADKEDILQMFDYEEVTKDTFYMAGKDDWKRFYTSKKLRAGGESS